MKARKSSIDLSAALIIRGRGLILVVKGQDTF